MKKAGAALPWIVLVLLVAYVTAMNLYVLPVWRAFFAETYIRLMLPTRVALLLGSGAMLWVVPVLVIVILAIGVLRERGAAPVQGARRGALDLANLLLVLYVILQGAVAVDTAILIPHVLNARQHAVAAPTPPTP